MNNNLFYFSFVTNSQSLRVAVRRVVARSCAVALCTIFRRGLFQGPCGITCFILRAVTLHFTMHSYSADPGHREQPGAEKATDGPGCLHEDGGLSLYGHLLWRALPGGK